MKDIKSNVKSGLKWTFSSTLIKAVISFILLIFLTYWLGKENLGLISIITVIFGLSETLVQFGVAQSIIRRQDISRNELSSIFWFNVGIGVILFTLTYISADIVAQFYNAPSLSFYVRVLAFIFLVIPLELIFRALLERDLNFPLTEKINMIKSVVMLFVAIFLVICGLGVLGYVYAMLISTMVSAFIFIAYFTKSGLWLPSFYFKIKDLHNHIHFGFFVTAKAFITYFGRNFDELIIGKVLGLEVLGVYFFAKRAIETPRIMFTNSLGKVAFPIFSKLKSHTSELRQTYLKLTEVIAIFGFLIFGLLIVIIPYLLPIAFGAVWEDEVRLFQIFCLISIVSMAFVDTFSSSLLYIYDKQKYVFMVDVIFTPIRLLLVYFAAQISIEMVALSFLLIVFLKSLLLQYEVNKYLVLSLREYLGHLVRASSCLVVASITAITCYFLPLGYFTDVAVALSFVIAYITVFVYIKRISPNTINGLNVLIKK
jgi:O-antigen/teichoic acid export membrane protein